MEARWAVGVCFLRTAWWDMIAMARSTMTGLSQNSRKWRLLKPTVGNNSQLTRVPFHWEGAAPKNHLLHNKRVPQYVQYTAVSYAVCEYFIVWMLKVELK